MATSSMRMAGLHHNCIVMAHSATYASVRRLLWHSGTPIINLHETILMHRLDGMHTHALTMARLTWKQTAGGTVRTVRSTRVATRARGQGRTGRSDGSPAGLTPGSAHCAGKPRGSGWDSGRTKLPNPRAMSPDALAQLEARELRVCRGLHAYLCRGLHAYVRRHDAAWLRGVEDHVRMAQRRCGRVRGLWQGRRRRRRRQSARRVAARECVWRA